MRRNIFNIRLFFSLLIGLIGIFSLTLNFLIIALGEGPTYSKWDYTIWKKIVNVYFEIAHKTASLNGLPFLIGAILIEGIWFAFIIFCIFSPFGILLAVKSMNSDTRKLAIFAIVLNSINLIFALFIAWLLFGLARGM
jgi:uncharacterized protein YacL